MKITSRKGTGHDTEIYDDDGNDLLSALRVSKIEIEIKAGCSNKLVLTSYLDTFEIMILPKYCKQIIITHGLWYRLKESFKECFVFLFL